MNKAKIFLLLSLSFIAGIFSASFYYPHVVDIFYLFLVLILSLIVLFICYKNKQIYLVTFVILFFLTGVWLTTYRLEKISNLNQEKRNFSGEVIVSKEPAIKDRLQKIVVKTRTLGVLGHPVSKREKFLITTNASAVYEYGDKLKVSCNLEIPENFNGFDYRMYLAKDNILHLCKNPKIELVEKNQGNRAYTMILYFKDKLQDKIIALLSAPQSGLLIGLILGGDDKLSQTVQDNFSKTGLTHIVAVSGYNVTIVAEYLMLLGIFLGLWRKQAFWFAIVGIFLFVVMTGFPASAVRAGVMGSLILWAMKNGRLSNAQNSIIFSAMIMLLINPLLLRWDVGFQLSFLATIGIVYFYPLIEKYSIKKNGVAFLSEILFLTLSAQVFVLPIILTDFQKLSVISPLANVLVLPIIPLTMLLGFLMVVLTFVFPPLATILAWLTYLPLKYEITIIEWMANLKFASVEITNFSWGFVVIWYIILIGILYFSRRRRDEEKVPF
ncbi:MAG: internalization-related competence protein ComEC/Rec2 protein [Candidatus Moranbacteria bacterium GW2011_GWA2_39_41]|nr:MAG: internalization-related competence protein ComEC/Rec2 protein [Candidatus Moranbacteria bacterium GW2011_GWA2_39_41]